MGLSGSQWVSVGLSVSQWVSVGLSGSQWVSLSLSDSHELVSTPNLVSALSFWVLLPNLSDCHAHDAYQSGKGKVEDDCVDVSRKRVFWFFFPIVLCAAWPLWTAIIVILFQKCMRLLPILWQFISVLFCLLNNCCLCNCKFDFSEFQRKMHRKWLCHLHIQNMFHKRTLSNYFIEKKCLELTYKVKGFNFLFSEPPRLVQINRNKGHDIVESVNVSCIADHVFPEPTIDLYHGQGPSRLAFGIFWFYES